MLAAISGFHKHAAIERALNEQRLIAERRRRAQRWPLPGNTMMVARLLGVSCRCVQYWRAGQRRPRPDNRYRLWALRILLNRAAAGGRVWS